MILTKLVMIEPVWNIDVNESWSALASSAFLKILALMLKFRVAFGY
jgi:hypothetical protein